MASILEVYQGATTLLPTTTWAAPNGLFGATADRNDGSIYGWADSTSTITLPSSGLADGYIFLWGFEFEDTSNGRHNPQGKMVQASGTGTFASAATGGFNRDTSEDRSYVSGWSFVDNPSASSTFQFQWRRDIDTPTGGTVRAYIQAIPIFYADVGVYTSTSTTATGGTTPVQITGFTGTDGTNITISSNVVSMTGDNKRYLCLGGAYHQSVGNARTQRWFGFRVDGTKDDAAKGCMYLRNTANADGGESFIRLLETGTATRTVDLFQYRGDGVLAGQGGADVDGNTTGANSEHAMVVIELNDTAEVYSSVDSVGGQEFAVTGPVDVDIASTGDIEFNDAASFTRSTDTGVNAEQTMDVFAFANVSHAREASSIGSGSRWTVHGEFTFNGTENTDVGFHGNYNRGNQSTQDCHGSSTNQAAAFAVTSGDDIGVSNQELTGTEGGAGDIETQAGWVGFGLINLDSMEDSGADITKEPGTGSLSLTGYAPSRGSGLRLQGFAPTASVESAGGDITKEPGAGSLALTGETPTVLTTANHVVNPDAGSLTLSSDAPEILVSVTVAPDTGSLVLTGIIPDIVWTDNHIRAPPVGSLALNGLTPTINRTEHWVVLPDAGSLSLTGQAPVTGAGNNVIKQPDAGSLSLTGQTPTAATTANHFVDPANTALTLTGYAPSLDYSWTVDPLLGSLTISGLIPTVVAGDNKIIQPDAGGLTFTGQIPTADTSDLKVVQPGTGSLTLTGYVNYNYGGPGLRLIGYEPAVVIEATVATAEPGAGSLALTGYAPTLGFDWVVDPSAGVLTLTGYAPVATQDSGAQTVQPDAGSLTLTGLVPAALAGDNRIVQPDAGSLTIEPHAPAVEIVINGAAASLQISGLVPTVALEANHTAQPDTGSLTLTGETPAALAGDDKVAQPSNGALSLAGLLPTIEQDSGPRTAAPDAGSLQINGLAPAVLVAAAGDHISQPDSGSLTLTGLSPTVVATGVVPVPGTGLGGQVFDPVSDREDEIRRLRKLKDEKDLIAILKAVAEHDIL